MKWYLALICLVASLGGFLFGFDTAVISGTVEHVREQFQIGDLWVGWFTSSALVGCVFGAMSAGYLGDKFGRKPILILSAILFFISAFGSTFPPSFTMLLTARFVGGLGVGLASVLSPMYISEFAPPKVRGRLVALYQLSIVIGILIAYFSNWYLQKQAGSAMVVSTSGIANWVFKAEVWRAMFGAEMFPALAFGLLLLIVPRSPRWLVLAGKDDWALRVLGRLSPLPQAEKELHAIEESLREKKGGIRELFKPGLRTALMIGVGLSVFGQLSGVNIVVYYGPTIIKNVGYTLDSAMQFQVALGLINLVFTVIALFLIDKIGRKALLVGGMIIVALSMLTSGIVLAINPAPGLVIIILLGIYMASIALSISAVIWVIIPEIYPNHIRGRAASIATLANWGTNAMSAYLFPWYVGVAGIHTGFITFGVICIIGTLFFIKYVPETKGKSLEEIALFFRR